MKTVKDYIRTIPDFPHKGILFRDVTTLFADPRGFRLAIDQMLEPYVGQKIDTVVGLEARGFILGGAIAHQLSAGFVPIRKRGNYQGPLFVRLIRLNMARRLSNCMTTPCKLARGSCWLMICWQPEAPQRRASHCWNALALRSSVAPLLSNYPILVVAPSWKQWEWTFTPYAPLMDSKPRCAMPA